MLDELGSLIEGIRLAPDDPLPRLVCADWLEENDRAAQAELVRVQCSLVGIPVRSGEYTALKVREAELIQEAIDREPDWPGGLRPGDYERGFYSHASCGVEDLGILERGEYPPMPIDSLTLHSLAGKVYRAGLSPVWGRIRSLHLGDGLGTWTISRMFTNVGSVPGIDGAALGSFLEEADLSNLESLTVEFHHRVGGSGLEALCRTRLPRLRELSLVAQNLGDNDLPHLASATWLGQLTSLTLWGNRITSVGATYLASRLPVLAGLKSLDLSGNPLRGDGLAALLRASWGDGLEVLKLADCGLFDIALRTLARSSAVRNLRELDLSGEPEGNSTPDTAFGPVGIAALARSPNFDALESLALNHRGLRGDSIERMAKGFPKLERLSLNGNPLGVQGARLLTEAEWWEELTTLHLAYAGLEDSGIDRMWRAEPLALRELDLNGNGISNRGAGLLSRPGWLNNLLVLRLHNNGIGAVGAHSIARSESLKNLVQLRLGSNPLRQRIIDAMRKVYGNRVQF